MEHHKQKQEGQGPPPPLLLTNPKAPSQDHHPPQGPTHSSEHPRLEASVVESEEHLQAPVNTLNSLLRSLPKMSPSGQMENSHPRGEFHKSSGGPQFLLAASTSGLPVPSATWTLFRSSLNLLFLPSCPVATGHCPLFLVSVFAASCFVGPTFLPLPGVCAVE